VADVPSTTTTEDREQRSCETVQAVVLALLFAVLMVSANSIEPRARRTTSAKPCADVLAQDQPGINHGSAPTMRAGH
jgi:hypothetical protein